MFCSLRSASLIALVACATACGASPAAPADDTTTGGTTGDDSGGAGGSPAHGSGGAGGSPTHEGAGGKPAPTPDASAAVDTLVPEPDAASTDPDAAVPADAGGPISPKAIVPSAKCAGGAMMPGPTGMQTIMANGKKRTFLFHMVNGYDGKKAVPVLFAFHGAGGGAASFASGTYGGVDKMSADKAIRIFPQAFGGNTWSRDEPDDVMFMDAIVAWLGENVCYDTARVFASGQSSGSYFSHRFACDRGNIVRAVATSSGGQRKERTLDCKVAVSAWLSNGASDDPGHVMGTQQARDVWLKLAGCSLTGATPTTPSPCVAYPGCREGYAVHYCQHPGGHPFPSYGTAGVIDFLFNSKVF
jgi:polyhydroxybutyrate depolymerase